MNLSQKVYYNEIYLFIIKIDSYCCCLHLKEIDKIHNILTFRVDLRPININMIAIL